MPDIVIKAENIGKKYITGHQAERGGYTRAGESNTVEFKASFNRETVESLCAFANTEGGQVLIGVSDSGQIPGLDLSDETVQGWLNQIKQSTTPSLLPDIVVKEVAAKKILKNMVAAIFGYVKRSKAIPPCALITKRVAMGIW